MTTPEPWEKEIKGFEMILGDGSLKGCLVYHEAVISLIRTTIAEVVEAEREKKFEEYGFICGAIESNNGKLFSSGCGGHVSLKDQYRCVDCTASFHRECIKNHFLDSLNKKL